MLRHLTTLTLRIHFEHRVGTFCIFRYGDRFQYLVTGVHYRRRRFEVAGYIVVGAVYFWQEYHMRWFMDGAMVEGEGYYGERPIWSNSGENTRHNPETYM